jgi:hypothetical protein
MLQIKGEKKEKSCCKLQLHTEKRSWIEQILCKRYTGEQRINSVKDHEIST